MVTLCEDEDEVKLTCVCTEPDTVLRLQCSQCHPHTSSSFRSASSTIFAHLTLQVRSEERPQMRHKSIGKVARAVSASMNRNHGYSGRSTRRREKGARLRECVWQRLVPG